MSKQQIRNFYGVILGTIEDESNGVQVAKNFFGQILGRYNPKENKTRNFFGQIVGDGNQLSGLIMQNNNNNKF